MATLVRTSIFCAALFLLQPLPALAEQTPAAPALRDGQHDFDFNVGGWKTHIRRLVHPLSGSNTWTELNGTVVVRKIWGGLGELEEIEADGQSGHFEGMTLFLYNPQAHQWNQYFANSNDGNLGDPEIGEFKDGRSESYAQDTFNGRAILVRMVWEDITATTHHVEQSFSADGGKTWEANFIADLTRDDQAATEAAIPPESADPQQHGFDWQLGSWDIHMSRLLHPLTGSTTWSPLDGTVVVQKVWGGKANLAEINTQGPSGQLQFIALRLYNPQAQQWNLYFVHSDSGVVGTPPLIGEFHDGRGVFYAQDSLNGKAILVRFTFSVNNADSTRDEQAFSNDGGKTWEVNWINTQTRTKVGSTGAL